MPYKDEWKKAAYRRKYYMLNREKYLAYSKRYYHEHKDYFREYRIEYNKLLKDL